MVRVKRLRLRIMARFKVIVRIIWLRLLSGLEFRAWDGVRI